MKATMKLKVRKGATVEVITGDDKGKRGAVLEVHPGTMKVRVQGVRVQTKHDKKEGLLKREGMIDYSNVKLVEAAATQPKKKAKKKTASKSA
jgi:large subunit ribosomal protein L24